MPDATLTLRRIALMGFSLPFRAPFATAQGTQTRRDGVLLRLETGHGAVGLGEASPLAVLGGGTAAESASLLRDLAPRLVGLDLGQADDLLCRLPAARPGGAAARAALDTALCDLRGQAAGVAVAALLAPAPAPAVPVNATVGAAGADAAAEAARRAIAAGFLCVKLKVGIAGTTVHDEIARIAAVRAALGSRPRLRLDANGAWTPETAAAILRAAAPYDLDLVEQPVAADDLPGMARVRATAGMPIAADEAARDLASARRVVEAGAADILVVKPMRAGGLRAGAAILALARQAGLGAIVTTTVDAGVGTAMALHLAAALPAPLAACGLATGPLLQDDLLARPLHVEAGLMHLPPDPGLGMALDEARAARYGDGWREVARR